MTVLPVDDDRVVALTKAIRTGDTARLSQLLRDHPELATARFGDDNGARTSLHVATDWPGNLPNGAAVVGMLVKAGADVNARFSGPHSETPLHWAASSDDVAVLDALLDAGADIEADGAVVARGTPMFDAVAFGQWKAARRLVEKGAATTMWQAAALGLLDLVRDAVAETSPSPEEITNALWHACHGGQQAVAEYLLEQGGDPNWVGWEDKTPLDAARAAGADDVAAWLESKGARGAST